MPKPINQCDEKVIFRQVFSAENEGKRVKRRTFSFNIIPQKMSLEIE